MSDALQELKSMLLSNSVQALDIVNQGTSVVAALQSLLKVAEIRNKCCLLKGCAHHTLTSPHKFALNISIENERVTPLLRQSSSTGIHYEPQSEGDSTETDTSYESADEGYDVRVNVIFWHMIDEWLFPFVCAG